MLTYLEKGHQPCSSVSSTSDYLLTEFMSRPSAFAKRKPDVRKSSAVLDMETENQSHLLGEFAIPVYRPKAIRVYSVTCGGISGQPYSAKFDQQDTSDVEEEQVEMSSPVLVSSGRVVVATSEKLEASQHSFLWSKQKLEAASEATSSQDRKEDTENDGFSDGEDSQEVSPASAILDPRLLQMFGPDSRLRVSAETEPDDDNLSKTCSEISDSTCSEHIDNDEHRPRPEKRAKLDEDDIQRSEFQCPECHKSYPYRANLKRHLRVHTGVRPHTCTQCQKSFFQISDLKRHMRTHNSARPHPCPKCSKSFIDIGYLNKHMHIHSGDKPFKCTLCPKSFPYPSYLKRHMRSHENPKPEQPETRVFEEDSNSDATLHHREAPPFIRRPYQVSQAPASRQVSTNYEGEWQQQPQSTQEKKQPPLIISTSYSSQKRLVSVPTHTYSSERTHFQNPTRAFY
eukprot:gb/GEZN01005517.1/.p1 GENE.gb/GEZN01005517.1/~~gb/GEZN01005517.1/.p1  ORF type:complete len:455 (+),score=40.79 gb/GEZN01005517.1/:106-1470(+)